MNTPRLFPRYVPFVGLLVVLVITGFGCGKSEWGVHLRKLSEDTKHEKKAGDVQAALAGFFTSEQALTNSLPSEITSLPIFSDDPTNIVVTRCGDSTNVLMLYVGGGFGHWGLLVAKPGHDGEISQWHKDRIEPWDDGIYFYSEYKD